MNKNRWLLEEIGKSFFPSISAACTETAHRWSGMGLQGPPAQRTGLPGAPVPSLAGPPAVQILCLPLGYSLMAAPGVERLSHPVN